MLEKQNNCLTNTVELPGPSHLLGAELEVQRRATSQLYRQICALWKWPQGRGGLEPRGE